MKKIEFESVEQAEKLWFDVILKIWDREKYIEMLKDKGYIKKSDLEIAKMQYVAGFGQGFSSNKYIELLEKEIKKLRGEKN